MVHLSGLDFKLAKKLYFAKALSIHDLATWDPTGESIILVGFDIYKNLVVERLKEETIRIKVKGFQISLKSMSFFYYLDSITPDSHEVFSENIYKNLTINLNASLFFNVTAVESLVLTVHFRKCKIGEYYDLNSLHCLECKPNTFLFLNDYLEASICKSCIGENFYCYGGFNISPKLNYWRRSEVSLKFLHCPNQGKH